MDHEKKSEEQREPKNPLCQRGVWRRAIELLKRRTTDAEGGE